MFLNMLKSFKSKHDYIMWHSEQTKLKMCHSEDANRPQEEKMDSYVNKGQSKKESSVFDLKKQSIHQKWIIKNSKVVIDFDTLWVVTRLFEFNSS